MMKRKLTMLLALCLAFSLMAVPAYAAEYTIDAPEAGLFAEPTSQHTVYVGTSNTTNIDRSKNAAYIPPAFGSPTSYLPGSGELLAPNLVAGQTAATVQTVTTTVQTGTGSQSITIPSVVQTGTQTYTPTGYTAVTDSLYYADDSLGTISISEIGLTVKVYQGTSDAALKKGAGHFSSTSIWNGNAAFAAHNRGVTNHFGNIHTLSVGDEIVYKTKLGSRTYEVYSVAKIAVDDVSVLNDTADNIITLITCVRDQPAYRWCVQAKCIG